MRCATPVAVSVLAILAPACQRETRVVSTNPFLGRLPGAQTQLPIKDLGGRPAPSAPASDATSAPSLDLPKDQDGKRIVACRNGRQLLSAIQILVREDDADAFVTQALCQATRQEYLERGLDPKQAFDTIKARQKDLAQLAHALPLGEQTPGAFMAKVAPRTLRVELTGPMTRDMTWRGYDMVLEGATYRLRWFIGD